MTSRPRHRSHQRRCAAALLLTSLVLALIGTAGGVASADEPVAAAPGKSWVRVGHFVPGMDATSVELQPLDGPGDPITLSGEVTYGQVSAYDRLPPGRYTATVFDSGAPSDSAPLLSRSLDVVANDARTVAVVGTAASPRLVVLSDDLTPPQAGTARIRLLSASQSADTVTVQAVDGPTIAEDAVLGQATSYATVPAGAWTLELSSTTAAAATLQDVPVMSGSVYTIVVLDGGQDQVRLEVVTDAAGTTMAPRGGAKTGAGGAALAPDAGTPGWLLGVVAVLVAGMAAVGAVGARFVAAPGRGPARGR